MPPALQTERLLLRPFTGANADAAYDALETHPDVWKHDPGFARTREQRAADDLDFPIPQRSALWLPRNNLAKSCR